MCITGASSTPVVRVRESKGGAPSASAAGTTMSFPVDFFESCTVVSDVEYGGADLLSRLVG